MTHEGAVHLIGDLLHGRLSGGIRDEMLSHLRACRECRSMSETYAILSAAWEAPGDREEHPPSDLIVRYALDEDGLDERDRHRVASHVLRCTLCASEMEVTSEAEAELAGSEAAPAQPVETVEAGPSRSMYYAPAIAAAVVLVLLAYPAYLGLFEVPRINERIASLEENRTVDTPQYRGGPVHSVFLQSPLRAAGSSAPEILMPAGYEFGELEVDPGSLEEYEPSGVGRFDLADSKGAALWSRELTLDEMRASVREHDAIKLVVPAESLPVGTLKLTVSTGSEPLFEAPFRVVRE